MQVLLTVAYDGTMYCGWQRQKNGMAVQQKIEEALSDVFSKTVGITGASRTDAGVHALGQKAAFFLDYSPIPLEKLPFVINGRLPEDIRILQAEEKPETFHPRFDAVKKTYEYRFFNGPVQLPQYRNMSWFIPGFLDVAAMQQAVGSFLGEHDFHAFCASGGSAKTFVRTIYDIRLEKISGDLISLVLNGSGFLYNMVRIIAGTLVYVGKGKIDAGEIPDILLSQDRTRAGITAPPQGLTLVEVHYG